MNAMKYIRALGMGLMLFLSGRLFASELQDYVLKCQSELKFQANQVPELDCNKGDLFAFAGGSAPINDWLVYHKVNEKVDLTAACRWGNNTFDNSAFVSLEMIIHNRETGGTCFFGAKDTITDRTGKLTARPVPNPIVSATNFNPSAVDPSVPAADFYWLQPSELNNRKLPTNPENTPAEDDFVRCVRCHAQGPYIASASIVPNLAKFGLINNRHDTMVNFGKGNYYAIGSNSHLDPAVGDNPGHPFAEWNNLIYKSITPSCSSGCHQVAENTTIGSFFPDQDIVGDFMERRVRILTSISTVIQGLVETKMMRPADEASDFRWMNLETPWSGIEFETFEGAKNSANGQASSSILSNCGVPGYAEAHAVGLDAEHSFSSLEMEWIPDRLNTFNVKEGVLCLNAEQVPGKTCANYETSYLCEGSWTDETLGYWFNTDSPANTGDHEQRSRVSQSYPELCANPTAIKTRFQLGTQPAVVHGPSDRLAQFSKQRLVCNSKDQVDGQCNNYVVRYRACDIGPPTGSAFVSSVWTGRMLTASNGSNSAQVWGQPNDPNWNTQKWMLEEEANTPYVRLRNTGTNTYLNVRGKEENALIETYEIRDWDSQRWVMESIAGSNQVRFKNVWSGKYLTLRDTSDYSAVYSQDLRPLWPSQRWQLPSF